MIIFNATGFQLFRFYKYNSATFHQLIRCDQKPWLFDFDAFLSEVDGLHFGVAFVSISNVGGLDDVLMVVIKFCNFQIREVDITLFIA